MSSSPKATAQKLIQVIESARNAESCRDINELQKILQTCGDLHGCLNDLFTDCENALRAELLRLYGFYLTFAGRAKNQKDFHLRAKDALTISVELFTRERLTAKAAEAKVILAFAYWNNGEVENSEALLELVEHDFRGEHHHPVSFQIKINRMMMLCWSGRLTAARQLAGELAKTGEFCGDVRLRAMYHSEAAIIFHHSRQIAPALFHFGEAVRLAKECSIPNFLALNYNNLSLLYLDEKNYAKAHEYSQSALEILEKIEHTGWIPHILDSRALIFLAQGKTKRAAALTEQALGYFYRSDDYKGLAGALWTKCQILLRQEQMTEALVTLAELIAGARANIGEAAVGRYADLFAREIYTLRRLPYTEEVGEFKKSLIASALKAAHGKKTEAAKALGLNNHQHLSDILKNQFPGLSEELGFTGREPRRDKNQAKPADGARRTIKAVPKKVMTEKASGNRKPLVAQLDPGGKMLSFSWNLNTEKYLIFHFNAPVMRRLLEPAEDSVVILLPDDAVKPGRFGVALDGTRFVGGIIVRDDFSGLDYLEWDGETVFVTTENIVGYPVAYQTVARSKSEVIELIKI